jgi:hypothetical protein
VIGAVYQIVPSQVVDGATVAALQAGGTVLDATLVLSQINLPTIRFNDGFPTADGRVIRVPGGAVLTEYFSLHLEGIIKLPDGATDGNYQFALLADDGAVLQIDDGSGFRTIVNNDGVHKNTFKTGEYLALDSTSRIKFKLDYFQGPREHMAITLLWRQVADVTDSAQLAETGDGVPQDNEYFFNTATTPSTPQAPYTDLLTRWSVVPATAFVLPSGFTENPCKK